MKLVAVSEDQKNVILVNVTDDDAEVLRSIGWGIDASVNLMPSCDEAEIWKLKCE